MITLPWPITRALARELKCIVLYQESLLDSWQGQSAIFKGFNHTIGIPVTRCHKLSEEERSFKDTDIAWFVPKVRRILDDAIVRSHRMNYDNIIAVPNISEQLPPKLAAYLDTELLALCDKVKWEMI
jgi:hypothetical protein